LHEVDRQKMNRDNGRTTDGDSALHDKQDVLDLWSINPWLTSHMIGAVHSQGLDPAEQERVRAMFAARSDRSATATVEIRQELKKEG
jgi:hypothetical protein